MFVKGIFSDAETGTGDVSPDVAGFLTLSASGSDGSSFLLVPGDEGVIIRL